jgi:predicted glycogen debranching enzyme
MNQPILNSETLTNPELALRYDWLETNSLGAYASSTPLECHTRKYHGLLVAPMDNCPGRFNYLSKMDVSLSLDENIFHLSTNKYPGVFFPTGHKYLESFSAYPYPVWLFRIGDILIKKEVLMPQGENAVLLRYTLLESDKKIIFGAKPMLAYRNFHSLAEENFNIQVKMYDNNPKEWRIEPYQLMPALVIKTNKKMDFYPGPDWNRNYEYMREKSRGYDFKEDLFCPGMFEKKIKKGESITFLVSVGDTALKPDSLFTKECKLRSKLNTTNPSAMDILEAKSEQFLITHGKEGLSIIAGYPWFGEWGRDAMIALPGLTLAQNKFKEAMEILSYFSSLAYQGKLPNQVGVDLDTPSYNTIDAGLLYFYAIQAYEIASGDTKGVKEKLFQTMTEMLISMVREENSDLSILENGLLSVGSEHTQLTWMDAQAYGSPVTPRNGCAIEINALWYNAMKYYIEICEGNLCEELKILPELCEKVEMSFIETFWLESDPGYLADCVRGTYKDIAMRPNQLFAAALPYTLLDSKQIESVLERTTRELLTPKGLRTLSPKNPQYAGLYSGNQDNRDGAYHQGTVWPWLVGIYTDVYVRVYGNNKKKINELAEYFASLYTEDIVQYGLCSVSEIKNGNSPHEPKGTPFQAWSVSEVIRSYHLLKES